jgi:hypothetical protein
LEEEKRSKIDPAAIGMLTPGQVFRDCNRSCPLLQVTIAFPAPDQAHRYIQSTKAAPSRDPIRIWKSQKEELADFRSCWSTPILERTPLKGSPSEPD